MRTVIETPIFLKACATLFTETEPTQIVSAVAFDPESGDVIPATGGFRKLRFGRAGTGKRGGARVIYFYGGDSLPIFLFTAYAKSEKGNLSKAEQNEMAKMAKSFFADYRSKA